MDIMETVTARDIALHFVGDPKAKELEELIDALVTVRLHDEREVIASLRSERDALRESVKGLLEVADLEDFMRRPEHYEIVDRARSLLPDSKEDDASSSSS